MFLHFIVFCYEFILTKPYNCIQQFGWSILIAMCCLAVNANAANMSNTECCSSCADCFALSSEIPNPCAGTKEKPSGWTLVSQCPNSTSCMSFTCTVLTKSSVNSKFSSIHQACYTAKTLKSAIDAFKDAGTICASNFTTIDPIMG